MDKRIKITKIEIVTAEGKKTLTKNEMKKFCEEKIAISIEESVDVTKKLRSGKILVPIIPPSKKKAQVVLKKKIPEIGDFCFAKVRGYSEWPAVITDIKNSKQFCVKFFNSSEM